MLRKWTRLLPVAFVAWYARRNCQIVRQDEKNRIYVMPYSDVMIRKETP
jgi:hypothetical protein